MGLLDGKVAIVTGAGHGIGRGHALELAKHGAGVVVNDLGSSVTGEGSSQDADLTVKLIEQRGGEAVANYGDVSDETQSGEMIQQAVDTWGRLDVLVNNAGIVRDSVIWNMPVTDFDAVMRVHVRGTWLPCHHAANHWRQRAKDGETFTGRVINTVSGAGLVGNFGQTNYATAKAAIAGLTQTLSLELYRMGVTVNAIGPAAATRITGTMPNAPQVIEADDIAEDEWNPMDPSVSSPVVAWLASDESQLVTGQVIRAVAENIILMEGWRDGATINNGGKRWDATKLGQQLATDVFKIRAPACGTDLKTVVVAGPGALPHADAVRQFAERTNLGVVNTWGLKGLFRWDSPFHLGTAGLQERDFELAGIDGNVRVIGIGLDEDESPRVLLGDLTEVEPRDLDTLADELGRAPEPPERPRLYTELAAAVGPLYESAAMPLNPARAARDLAQAAAFVAADPGPAGLWVARTFPTVELGSVKVPARRSPAAAVQLALADGAGRSAVAVTTAPIDAETAAVLERSEHAVLEVWGGDGDVSSPDERIERLAAAVASPGVHVLNVPVDFSFTRVLVEIAGPVRAWL